MKRAAPDVYGDSDDGDETTQRRIRPFQRLPYPARATVYTLRRWILRAVATCDPKKMSFQRGYHAAYNSHTTWTQLGQGGKDAFELNLFALVFEAFDSEFEHKLELPLPDVNLAGTLLWWKARHDQALMMIDDVFHYQRRIWYPHFSPGRDEFWAITAEARNKALRPRIVDAICAGHRMRWERTLDMPRGSWFAYCRNTYPFTFAHLDVADPKLLALFELHQLTRDETLFWCWLMRSLPLECRLAILLEAQLGVWRTMCD